MANLSNMFGRFEVGKRFGSISGVALLFIVLLLVFFIGRGEGAVLTVDDDPGSGDFNRIEDAIGEDAE